MSGAGLSAHLLIYELDTHGATLSFEKKQARMWLCLPKIKAFSSFSLI